MVGLSETREEEEGFLNGRGSKEVGIGLGKGEGETKGSGETSFAFRLPPEAFLTGKAILATFLLKVFGFEFPSLAGVPVFGKTHFFLICAQERQTRPLPLIGRVQDISDAVQRSHYRHIKKKRKSVEIRHVL